MTQQGEGDERGGDRIAEASDWFARMRGPDADAVRDEFAAWHAEPDNARAYKEIAAIWSVAGMGNGASSPEPKKAASARRLSVSPTLIAAGLGTALVLGFVVHGSISRNDPAAGKHYASAAETPRTVALADGSKIALETGSRINFTLGDADRQVVLESGGARFTVAHDAARPFIVLVGGRAIIARGTVFDVRLNRGVVEVSLLEGQVDLEQRAANAASRKVGTLRPGDIATFPASGDMPRIVRAAASSDPAGLLSGDGMRLGEIVAAANRQGGTQIVLSEPGLADLRVSGGVRSEEPAKLAATLAAALDLSLTRSADRALVLAPTEPSPAAR